ncbi:MAG: formylglycine-generating enzyme family protein [Magnetococcales bacterium]|nr:formylglycine-generating enzyme family protein [Magnetococcales bacterium]
MAGRYWTTVLAASVGLLMAWSLAGHQADAFPVNEWEPLRDSASVAAIAETLHAGAPWREPTSGMAFVWMPEGCFRMGNANSEDRDHDEGPVHDVCLSGFWLGQHEVTQGEWRQVMHNNPAQFRRGDDYPVERVSWDDAEMFIGKMNRLYEGRLLFRLPTESEWEYSCRDGGHDVRYAGGGDADRVAWYQHNSGGSPQRHSSRAANHLGLADMSGNVWEWVHDSYRGDGYSKHGRDNPVWAGETVYRVIRGGAWNTPVAAVRCANRGFESFISKKPDIGLRLVVTLPKKGENRGRPSLKDLPL